MKPGATTGDVDRFVAQADAVAAHAQDIAVTRVYVIGIPFERDSAAGRLWRWLVRPPAPAVSP